MALPRKDLLETNILIKKNFFSNYTNSYMYIVLCFGYKTWGYLNNIMAEFFRFETIKLGASFLCEDNFDSKSGAQRAT